MDREAFITYVAEFLWVRAIAAGELFDKLSEAGVINPVKPTVLVVRHPDSETQIEISPYIDAIHLIEVDLGSSFDGEPDPDDEEEVAVAREIIRNLTEGSAHLPDNDPVRNTALSWAHSLADGLPEPECWLESNGYGTTVNDADEEVPAGYMADPTEQAEECKRLRSREVCPVHG